MDINFERISKNEFDVSNAYLLFENNSIDRSFGLLRTNEVVYKMGWQSTDIQPVVTSINENVFSVGIDLNFVICGIKQYSIELALGLNCFFYDSLVKGKFMYVLTELEVFRISVENFQKITKYSLPDYFRDINFDGDDVKIICMDGSVING